MTVRIYRSTDTSAPTLTGQVGSLTALLDAILVNGYGSTTAAGWTINQTTTNKRGYLQNTTGSNNPSGELLYIDDTGPGAGGAREARACGFETMSAITPTGTGQFPTSGQSAIGVGTVVIRKSATADSTARAWTAIANGQTLYLFIEGGDFTQPIVATPFVFGDFASYHASDSYAVAIVGRTVENSALFSCDPLTSLYASSATLLTMSIIGHFADRSWTGVGGSVPIGTHVDQTKLYVGTGSAGSTGTVLPNVGAASTSIGSNPLNPTTFPYPNPADGALWMSPIFIHHSGGVRGYFLGLWGPLHDRPLNHDDTFTVTGGNLNGKSFVAQNAASWWTNANFWGQLIVETSNTWS